MVEVAHFANGIAPPLLAGSALRNIVGGSRFVGAKIALDASAKASSRTCVEMEEGDGGNWESASLTSALESPRRQLLRNMFVAKHERQAVREQRRLEIERELLVRLGMNDADTDGLSPDGVPSVCAVSIDNIEAMDRQPRGNDVRPHSRSSGRPGSGRRVGLSNSSGPSRPPKPKPHRPLNLNEDTSPIAETSADALPEERRWKSALLPVWPDRQGSSGDNYSNGVPLSLSCSDPVVTNSGSNTDIEKDLASARFPSGCSVLDMAPSQRRADLEVLTYHDSAIKVAQGSCSSRSTSPPSVAQHVSDAVSRSAQLAEALAVATEEHAKQLQDDVEKERRLREALHREQHLREAAQLEARTRELEASAQRLRDNVERLRLENRRARVFGNESSSSTDRKLVAAEENFNKEQGESISVPTDDSIRRQEEMRRKIAELDKVNELERRLLEKQELEIQERRRQQAEFERSLQECTERKMQEHRDREAIAELKRKEREEEKQREREDRVRRHQEQLHQQEEKSRRIEEQRREGRSEATQQKWQLIEEELDKQWAEQDEEERRRVESYAKERRKRFEAFDRRLASERQKFASEAEFTDAARHRQARNAAHADEQFYSSHRTNPDASSSYPSQPTDPLRPPMPPRPHPQGGIDGATTILIPDECAVLKELHSMRNQPRDSQKAKVKELLFRWHPDKNPMCADKATRVFQFIQKQREIILGL
mmetsp:Transcript_25906/g.41601  ORF Transcript_25906/g.41601 Transcript_25906/m.41601 type:complete len:713 (+) Transcript_25906:149-2287(+)